MRTQWVIWASALVLPIFGGGCVGPTSPAELFQLSPESPAHRAMQIRMFETGDRTELLSASAAVLQDLGFQVEESTRELGFLRATKERSAREYGQDITRFAVWILTTPLILGKSPPVMIPVDLHQKIAATLVARPINPTATRYEIRVMFYRVVWKGGGDASLPGRQWMEMIREPEIYQQFFVKLSKAVFLEAFTL